MKSDKFCFSQLLTEGGVPSEFILHDSLSPEEVEAWLKQGENFGPAWQKLLLKVNRKNC